MLRPCYYTEGCAGVEGGTDRNLSNVPGFCLRDRLLRGWKISTLCFCWSLKFQKSVWNLSDNCQLQKPVRKLSEMCQISVGNLSVTKLCQKYVRSNLEMSLKCIRYHKCVRKVSEICQLQNCVRNMSDQIWKCLGNVSDIINVLENCQCRIWKYVRKLS